MCFENWELLLTHNPKTETGWDRRRLCLYLEKSCEEAYTMQLQEYFRIYRNNAALADMLFSILLDTTEEKEDVQLAAAYYISQMDKAILRNRKEQLLRAQATPTDWKRPFLDDDLTWLY